ncbi:MAG: cellulase family glycosylhydrolase [Caldisericum sp.]|nr:cellulase family glycosylhydrolase [Caldisericum sp.]
MKKVLVFAILLALVLSSFSFSFHAQPVKGGDDTNDDWLFARGNQIVDKFGNPVWITGLNWFGFETNANVVHGLWSVNLKSTLTEVANRGFNFIRLPIYAELILNWSNGVYPSPNINYYANPELQGLNSLQVLDYFVKTAKEVGLKIMFDIHSIKPDDYTYPLWYKDNIKPEDYFKACEWLADRYKNDDTVLAFDLKNEPHGQPWSGQFAKWDNSTDINNWKYTAETCALRVLNKNPNLLIVIEGVEAYPKDGKTWTSTDASQYYLNWWGGNLRGVKDYPINLGTYQNKVVYSPHDYGPSVWNQPWFNKDFTMDTLYNDCWGPNWDFIRTQNIAPLLIGEWGGKLDNGSNQKWMTYLRDFIIKNKINYTFWCLNPNSGDTGGLLLDDFKTWDEQKYNFLKGALWQDSQGRFIGLDHTRPLGTNGKNINVAIYYNESNQNPPSVYGTISGKIWNDANGNGLLDSGEAGIPNVSITLKDSQGTIIGTTVTDASGSYNFNNLTDGTYIIEVAQPNGMIETFEDDGVKDNKTSVTISNGNSVVRNFGYKQDSTNQTSSDDINIHITNPKENDNITTSEFEVSGTLDIESSSNFNLVVKVNGETRIYQFVATGKSFGPIKVKMTDFTSIKVNETYNVTLQVLTQAPTIPPFQTGIRNIIWKPTASTFTLHIPSGWSIIAVPFEIPASTLNCKNVLFWDGTLWQNAQTLKPGLGYLVNNVDSPKDITITGNEVASPFSITVAGSYQLIGNPFIKGSSLSSTSNIKQILYWDGSMWKVASTSNLLPGVGYLIYVDSPGTITFTRQP